MKDLARRRVAAQWLAPSPSRSIAETARHLLACQAQDFPASTWALGIRTPGTTIADVDAAYEAKQIVRGWPLRGTLHVCAAEDLGWLTALTSARLVQGSRRRQEQLGLDARQLGRARTVAESALADGPRSRDEIYGAFERAKLAPGNQRGYHLLWHLALTGTVCLAGDRFALCATRIAAPRALDRDEALRELALRYFRSHGPATRADLQRWAKLTVAEAKRALDLARTELASSGDYLFDEAAPAPTRSMLALPGFDELILGYADRTCTVPAEHAQLVVPGANGYFQATLVDNGRAIGTWSRTGKVELFDGGPAPARVAAAVKRYSEFARRSARTSAA